MLAAMAGLEPVETITSSRKTARAPLSEVDSNLQPAAPAPPSKACLTLLVCCLSAEGTALSAPSPQKDQAPPEADTPVGFGSPTAGSQRSSLPPVKVCARCRARATPCLCMALS